MFRGFVGLVLVLTAVATLAYGQEVRGSLRGGEGLPGGLSVPWLQPDLLTTTLVWSAAPESVALRERWLNDFHRSLRLTSPAVALGTYDADDVCVYIGGSGGTSKLDGGGWLAALNPRYFHPEEDAVGLDVAAGVIGAPPLRLVIVDEFELNALSGAVANLGDRPFALPFIASGTIANATTTVEVVHGHLVAHHVAALLRQLGFALAPGVTVDGREPVDRLRLVFSRRDGASVDVDLYDADFDDLASLRTALGAVAASAATDGPAAVVLSWGLTGCALRDAYVSRGAMPLESEPSDGFQLLSDFAFAVAAAYDGFFMETGGVPVTRSICAAVNAFARFGAEGAESLDCGDGDVRARVATTVLFASYEAIAREAIVRAAPDDVVALADAHRYFAAAGNEGLPYPLPPASFDGVLAVAACKPTGPDRAWFSNHGDRNDDGTEAIALGAWFPVAFRAEVRNLGYWGTSFAAPLAALASGFGRETSERVDPTFANLCAPVRAPEAD